MKVTGLRTKVVNVPFAETPGAGSGALRSAGAVLVFLDCDQGLVGEDVAFALNGQRLGVLHDFIRTLGPLVLDLDPGLAGSFRMRAWKDVRRMGVSGLASSAIAPLDMAFLDLRAKAAELNVAALREAIGPRIGLMADANQRMTVPQAIRLGRGLEEFNLGWLEEPIDAFDHAGQAQIAAALDTPIACGESIFTSRGVREMLQLRAVDLLMPDLQHMGGPAGFLQAAGMAEAHDIPVSGHLFPEMSLGLLAAGPNASVLEYMPWLSPLYREGIELDSEGRAIVPLHRPGWGFGFDEDAIKRYSA